MAFKLFSGRKRMYTCEVGDTKITSGVKEGSALYEFGLNNSITEYLFIAGKWVEFKQNVSSKFSSYDNPSLDAFSRMRVSQPTLIFESQLQYDLQPLIWNQEITGTGSVTHLPNESSGSMEVGTDSGDKIVRQTKQYFRYQAGKSFLGVLTAVPGAAKTNVRKRVGIFDDENGNFFEFDGSQISVVTRSYTSGEAVDKKVLQENWNVDKLDGTGKSGITIDPSKAHIFVIDYQWLGVGRIRFGVDYNGTVYYCHEVYNANNFPSVYMTTGNLPARLEIENTGATSEASSMKCICTSIISEGGFVDDLGITESASNGTTSIGVTTRRPILSIQLKPSFNGIVNRGLLRPLDFNILAETNSCFYEVVYNGTLTGASFSSISSSSIANIDVSATAISGGIVLKSGYITADSGFLSSFSTALGDAFKSKLTLSNSIDGLTTESISIVCTSLSGTSNVSSAITVKEVY
jgi:hypothetical protein